MGKFIDSFLTGRGDKVDMNLIEMAMYGLIPGLGQLLMRINKFGGSLDKPYLFFPLLLIPPFSFIPVLVAKFGFLKKTEGGNILDIYVLIPIIFRFILILIMAYLGNNNLILQSALILGSILITNILHVFNTERCKQLNPTIGEAFIKNISDSMIQFSISFAFIFLMKFVPVFGTLLEVLRNVPLPFIGNISSGIDSAIWSAGLVFGYMMMNMIDVNYYSAEEACKGKIGLVRNLIGVIAFAITIFYQYRKSASSITNSLIPL